MAHSILIAVMVELILPWEGKVEAALSERRANTGNSRPSVEKQDDQ